MNRLGGRTLRTRWLTLGAVLVAVAGLLGTVAYADTASGDGDVLKPNNRLQYGSGGFQEPCSGRGSAVAGAVTIRFNGTVHFDSGAMITVAATPDSAATAAGITASGSTTVVPTPWDTPQQTFTIPITTTVPASAPDGSYTVDVNATGPAHRDNGTALTFTSHDSVVVTIDCVANGNVAPAIAWNAHPFQASAGETKTYTFGISDLDSSSWTFAPGFPSCGSGTVSNASIDLVLGRGSFDCTFGSTPGSTTVRAQVTDGTSTSNELTQDVDVGVGPLASIALSPQTASILPGGSQAYTVEGFDALHNSRGDQTPLATFGITPDGSCTGAVCTASIYGPHTVTATVGGFTDTATLNVLDVTPPVTTAALAPPAVHGWYMHPTVTLSATDTGGSGVAHTDYRLDGVGSFQAYSAPFAVSGDGSHTLEYRSVDVAGNVETTQSLTFQIDATAPGITITTPAAGASYTLGQSVLAAYSCTDPGGSGIDTCLGTVGNTLPIETGSIGPKTFTVDATDLAGNTASKTVSYSVVYPFNGFFSPVDNPPTLNVVQAGSGIPVKFSLGGDRGLAIFASGYPRTTLVSCSSGATQDNVEETVNAGGSSLSYGGGQYNYVWKTDKAWAGTCRQLEVKFVDGTLHTALFKFK
jgi:hypothetical protein